MTKKIYFILIILLNCLFISAQTSTKNLDTTFFSHITFNDQERLPEGPKNHLLFWNTAKYIPNTYFIVEHFSWGRWVKRLKISEKSPVGKHEYYDKSGGKCEYRFKIQPHSGENRMRVLLMNDSNVCLAISKELKWISPITPKVSYTIKKKDKEIVFSNETYYELHDASGKLIEQGRAAIISYATLDEGEYTLYYDNSTATIKLK